ncbi:serine/threonine-protein kinase HipA [Pseudomonas flavescens]|uniref:Serine/threonine-protein kinase HipA n=1 Tax=Phytopseudomonas flavescens TaxID=29435 RepID=A0A1G8K1I3_9GAMM|nr:hypothetical protein [Pseudomonas flavescens]SDI37263.1 serine/threonine-protein kinase HipA [Pseudomonas flavescens]
MGDEHDFGLSMAGTRPWYDVTMEHFMAWAELPKSPINYSLRQSINAARSLWPQALAASPMAEPHKQALQTHWRALQADFRIEA